MIIEKNGYVIKDIRENEFIASSNDFSYDTTTEIDRAEFFENKEDAEMYIEEYIEEQYIPDFDIYYTEVTYWIDDDDEDEDDIYELINTKIQFAKMREDAIIPSKTIGNVGYDIYACFPENQMKIESHETKLIPTGIASIIPDGYAMILKDRGSTGSKGLSTACGVIDSNFRGEWFVAIHNENDFPVYIIKDNVEAPEGKCICYPYKKAITQAILIEDINAIVEEIDKSVLEVNVTDRGTGTLGSSGK